MFEWLMFEHCVVWLGYVICFEPAERFLVIFEYG